MFIQRCFIRKNTKELRDKILQLGNRTTIFDENYDMIIANPKNIICGNTRFKDDEYIINLGYIDCNTDENLFLALAALQDDTDNEQWFVYQDNSFLKCECDSKIDMWGDFEYPEIYPRKATVEELIEHFKNMKTVEEKARQNCEFNEFSLRQFDKHFIECFKDGVEFAQQFYLIERDQYSEIDVKQKEELECNMPILVKYLNEDGETTYDVFAEYYPVLQDPIYTHWRPINLK